MRRALDSARVRARYDPDLLPAGLDVQQIGRDFVLGVRRDSLDVESVMEYALKRP